MRVRAAVVAAIAGALAVVRIARSLGRAILQNPNRYYVNVHTAGLPDGAIRGQLFARQR